MYVCVCVCVGGGGGVENLKYLFLYILLTYLYNLMQYFTHLEMVIDDIFFYWRSLEPPRSMILNTNLHVCKPYFSRASEVLLTRAC